MNLKMVRAEKGLTQAQAADKIQCSRVTWLNLEAGTIWPNAIVLAEIACQFNVVVSISPEGVIDYQPVTK